MEDQHVTKTMLVSCDNINITVYNTTHTSLAHQEFPEQRLTNA